MISVQNLPKLDNDICQENARKSKKSQGNDEAEMTGTKSSSGSVASKVLNQEEQKFKLPFWSPNRAWIKRTFVDLLVLVYFNLFPIWFRRRHTIYVPSQCSEMYVCVHLW